MRIRVLNGAIAVPVVAGLLIAMDGCGTAGAAVPGVPRSTAVTSSTASSLTASSSTASSSITAAAVSASASRQLARPSSSATSAFPGIWDITTWQAYREAQAAVEQGHQPWLLDPESVVQAWARQWTPAPAVHRIAADSFEVTKPGTNVVYTVSGTCPDPASAAPIWVITAITHS